MEHVKNCAILNQFPVKFQQAFLARKSTRPLWTTARTAFVSFEKVLLSEKNARVLYLLFLFVQRQNSREWSTFYSHFK